MPGRRLPDTILSYLGNCRTPETPAEKVMNQVGLEKEMGSDGYLSDFDPLVVVLEIVTLEIEGLGLSPRGPTGGAVWIEVVSELQSPSGLHATEHNRFLPCRSCNRSFLPAVDLPLRRTFLAWHRTRGAKELVALHRCSECGGSIEELEAKVYEGDYHTPEPGFDGDDAQWGERLLAVSGLWAPD